MCTNTNGKNEKNTNIGTNFYNGASTYYTNINNKTNTNQVVKFLAIFYE